MAFQFKLSNDETAVKNIHFFCLPIFKMTVLWVVAPCSLVKFYRRFRRVCCLHHQGDDLMIEAASTSEASVIFYQTTRRDNPEDSHLHIRRRENLKSHLCQFSFRDIWQIVIKICDIMMCKKI
jgi:hypothetical protein